MIKLEDGGTTVTVLKDPTASWKATIKFHDEDELLFAVAFTTEELDQFITKLLVVRHG